MCVGEAFCKISAILTYPFLRTHTHRRTDGCQVKYYVPQNFFFRGHKNTHHYVSFILQKDLGGPLSCMVNGRFDLAGVGSFYRDECNSRFPSIFTSIPQYLNWVVDITGVSPRTPEEI